MPKLQLKPKEMHNCLPPEDIRVNTLYTFNFNPTIEPQRDGHGYKCTSFSKWSKDIDRQLKKLDNYGFNYYMVTELSRNARFHLHGVCYFTSEDDILNWYVHMIPRLKVWSAYEIDSIEDKFTWFAYMLKQSSRMRKFCEKNDMKYEYSSKGYKSI